MKCDILKANEAKSSPAHGFDIHLAKTDKFTIGIAGLNTKKLNLSVPRV